MVLFAKILQFALIVWIIRTVISFFVKSRVSPRSGVHRATNGVKRFDTSGKNVEDGDYREVR
jgi:hypothetical protein